MSKYTITPWRTQRDLLEVREQLYHPDEEGTVARRNAVNRVMAWKLRGNIPHAVESTALLIDAILHHEIKGNSIFSIRAVYSAAFCRFVTGFCDIGRHKERSLEPSSMLEIAKQIDMPTEFVALRHEATHEELPGIQRLVLATQQALDWVWKVYWSRLEEPGDEVGATKAALPALKDEMAELLRNYRRARRNALRNNAQDSPQQLRERAVTCSTLLKLSKASQPKVIAEVLVEERLVIPSNRELGSSLDGAYLIWDDLLSNVSTALRGFLPAFREYLLEALTRPETTEPKGNVVKEALAMWVLHLLDIQPGARGAFSANIMKWCCLHPGYWTQRVGKEVLEDGDRSLLDDWQDLFEASSLETAADREESDTRNGDIRSSPRDISERIAPSGSPKRTRDFEEEHQLDSWTRATVPVSAPIGVVR